MIESHVAADDELDAYVAVWNTITPDEPADVVQQRERRERDGRRCGRATTSPLEGYADVATFAAVSITPDDWLRGDDANVPEGSLVALAGDEIVGFSGLCRSPEGAFEDGLTVVRRAWRRRGVAEALNRAKLSGAAANGVTEIVTWTQRGNDGMRAVNERIGYAYRSVSITVRAALGAPAP